MIIHSVQDILNEVVNPCYCSGCGVCTVSGSLKMQLNSNGQFLPILTKNTNQKAVCPFMSNDIDENDIARQKFHNAQYHPDLGYYLNIYAGYVKKGNYRKKGSSGGSVTWFTDSLLQHGLVDYIIHVKENNQAEIRFSYDISNSVNESVKASKSKYYPVNLEAVLQYIQQHEGKYAIVGLPCFIKAIHLLKKTNSVFEKRIKYTISLFCGHLKTTHYLSSLIAQFKVTEQQVKHFDFRHKIPGQKVTDYATKIVTREGKELIKNNKDLFGTNWGWGLFKLKACDYCDDIIGETADISFGDAWIDKYEDDYLGTNIVVVRDTVLDQLLKNLIDKEEVFYENLSPEELLKSQAGGYRHRREGLAYRLYLQQKKGNIVPKKRVKPKKIKSRKRRKLYKIRMQLQEKSVESINYKNITELKNELMPLIKKMEKLYEHSLWTKFRLKLKKWLKKKYLYITSIV